MGGWLMGAQGIRNKDGVQMSITKDELITKQQLEIERLRSVVEEYEDRLGRIHLHFICVGNGLFNDSRLRFNREQMNYLRPVMELSEPSKTSLYK